MGSPLHNFLRNAEPGTAWVGPTLLAVHRLVGQRPMFKRTSSHNVQKCSVWSTLLGAWLLPYAVRSLVVDWLALFGTTPAGPSKNSTSTEAMACAFTKWVCP